MEPLTTFISAYWSYLTSWWWLSFAVLAFVFSLLMPLMFHDFNLPVLRALRLAFVGIINLFPPARKFLSFVDVWDFNEREKEISPEASSYGPYVLSSLFICYLAAPAALALELCVIGYNKYKYSYLGHDVQRHGWKWAIKMFVKQKFYNS